MHLLVVSFAQYLCTGFGNSYNYVLECSSEYRAGVPQSSTKGGTLNACTSNFSIADPLHFVCFRDYIR